MDTSEPVGPTQTANSSEVAEISRQPALQEASAPMLEPSLPLSAPSQNGGASRIIPTESSVRSRGSGNASIPQEHSIDMGFDPQDRVMSRNSDGFAGSKHEKIEGCERISRMKGRRIGSAGGKSVTVRKLLKKGNRTVREVRQLMTGYTKQITVGVVFVICIILILGLSSGDDDALTKTRRKSVGLSGSKVQLQDFSLPHVRVNPVLGHHGHPVSAPRAWAPRDHYHEDNADDDISVGNEIRSEKG